VAGAGAIGGARGAAGAAGAAGGGVRGHAPRGTNPPVPPGAGATSLNGFNRNRYLLCNDQVRRLPFAFVLIVDQTYRSDVVAALASSRLRFQVQQVYWRHNE